MLRDTNQRFDHEGVFHHGDTSWTTAQAGSAQIVSISNQSGPKTEELTDLYMVNIWFVFVFYLYFQGNVVLKKISRSKGEDLLEREQTVDIRLPPTIEWGHQKTTCT